MLMKIKQGDKVRVKSLEEIDEDKVIFYMGRNYKKKIKDASSHNDLTINNIIEPGGIRFSEDFPGGLAEELNPMRLYNIVVNDIDSYLFTDDEIEIVTE